MCFFTSGVRVFIFTLALCILFSTSVCAVQKKADIEKEIDGFSLSMQVGQYFFADSEDLEPGVLSGIRLGYEFREEDGFQNQLSIEGILNLIRTEDKTTNKETDVYQLRLDALYPLFTMRNIMPAASVGAGWIYYDDTVRNDSPIVSYGLTIKYLSQNNLQLRADLRHLFVLEDEKLNNFEATLGFTYILGQPKPAPTENKSDKDSDGVADILDKCPDSPAGLAVDRKGCTINPPDDDGDKIPNYLDQCLNTPRGVMVEENGCQPDRDQDGVPDYRDKCIRNPKGFPVNSDGCI